MKQNQGLEKKVEKYQYNTSNILGDGSYGTVYKGINTLTQQPIAIKVIPRQKVYDAEALSFELRILAKLKGDNIVRLHETLMTQNNYYQIIDLCDGDLKQLLDKQTFLTEQEAINMMIDLLRGFLELIQNGIIHRDVKPANILISKGTYKLADFGFARLVDNYAQQLFVTVLGTPLYMSPQLLQNLQYSTKCDIWSLGFIFYEVLFGRTPWSANSIPELIKNINEKPLLFPDKIKQVSEYVKDVVRRCLVINEDERIGWYDLYKHPLFAYQFKDIANLEEICNNKEKMIAQTLRNEIVRKDLSLDQLVIKLNWGPQVTIKDIENLFSRVDPQLQRIQIEHIFNNIQKANNQYLTLQEFQQWLDKFQIPFQSYRQNPIECFRVIKQTMKNYNQTLDQYFDKFNQAKDGKLKFEEFKQFILRCNNQIFDSWIKSSFEFLDRKKQGFVTLQELQQQLDKTN
ncbi:unnamed protein product (macronuclear) [Paramecium tetraurelia]|uniref:Protein kinase domain-containing protein n=1 Tax=Paramecium tetraurelia TaxID=5888 RepID=A0C1C8_PARTE|nr:uncharacterized protein GSPATT00034071001 [Paramecium tetraurelia]CAK64595.1 unnamed protein product [Paramecium tetraurelia]|eukprot:XP_001431993.1 hypothetical protein (macronuclear) [Paramecium tetraurelia strain d4-2]